ncbi:hypothetical protein HAX54_027784, partial [Datura stramonium]|nr:hypothetical protein [Datura stramonium]
EDPWSRSVKLFPNHESPLRAVVCGYDLWPEVVTSLWSYHVNDCTGNSMTHRIELQ